MSRKKVKEKKKSHCACCKKEVKKSLGYFRDEKYYCNLNHWKKLRKKEAKGKKNNEISR